MRRINSASRKKAYTRNSRQDEETYKKYALEYFKRFGSKELPDFEESMVDWKSKHKGTGDVWRTTSVARLLTLREMIIIELLLDKKETNQTKEHFTSGPPPAKSKSTYKAYEPGFRTAKIMDARIRELAIPISHLAALHGGSSAGLLGVLPLNDLERLLKFSTMLVDFCAALNLDLKEMFEIYVSDLRVAAAHQINSSIKNGTILTGPIPGSTHAVVGQVGSTTLIDLPVSNK